MSANLKYYLAKNQKTFGPLSQEEIDHLRKSGNIEQYTWIFKENDQQWTAIDPAPPIPTALHDIQPAALQERATSSRRPLPPPVSRPVMQVEQSAYRIVLFDHRNAISGWLTSASDGGCSIRSDQNGSDPLFVPREVASLTLHDTRTGESIKLRIRVGEITRADRGWTYQLRWEAAPAFLERSDKRSSEASVAA